MLVVAMEMRLDKPRNSKVNPTDRVTSVVVALIHGRYKNVITNDRHELLSLGEKLLDHIWLWSDQSEVSFGLLYRLEI